MQRHRRAGRCRCEANGAHSLELFFVASVAKGAKEFLEEVTAFQVVAGLGFQEALPVKIRHEATRFAVLLVLAECCGKRHDDLGRPFAELAPEPCRFVLGGEELALLVDGLPSVETLSHVLDLSVGVCDLLSEGVIIVEQRLSLACELSRPIEALRFVRRRFEPSLDLVVKLPRRLVTIRRRFGERAQARFFELERDVAFRSSRSRCFRRVI